VRSAISSLVYDQQGTSGDPADVYYIRSTDWRCDLWHAAELNTDATDRPQWAAYLSVSPAGTLLATGMNARVSADTDCVYGTQPLRVQMFSRKSTTMARAGCLMIRLIGCSHPPCAA